MAWLDKSCAGTFYRWSTVCDKVWAAKAAKFHNKKIDCPITKSIAASKKILRHIKKIHRKLPNHKYLPQRDMYYGGETFI